MYSQPIEIGVLSKMISKKLNSFLATSLLFSPRVPKCLRHLFLKLCQSFLRTPPFSFNYLPIIFERMPISIGLTVLQRVKR
jgi:hypothetical protein